MVKFIDLEGKTFGKWYVIKRGSVSSSKAVKWLCKCECGRQIEVLGKSLRDGKSTKCVKCKDSNYRHGLSRSPTYHVWSYMIARCHNPNDTAYKFYGAKGVVVCQRWRDDFLNFYSDMGERPSNKTLDRVDPFGNYEKSNCRWATRREQNMNKRNSMVEKSIYNGFLLKKITDHKTHSIFECIDCGSELRYNRSMVKLGHKLCPQCFDKSCLRSFRD